VRLRTPGISDVAAHLVRTESVDPAIAAYAARAAQGHIGRARALATDESVRARHLDVLRFPQRLGGISTCLAAAGDLVAQAREQVTEVADPADAAELRELLAAYGDGGTGAGSARSKASAGIKELERAQRNRRRRLLRDELDRVLIDLAGLYRDVLTVLTGAEVALINSAARAEIDHLAAGSNPAAVLEVIDAIAAARLALASDGAEDLVFAQLAVAMRRAQLDGGRTGQVAAGRVP
jgi:DNA polymerase-3 subunit delta'